MVKSIISTLICIFLLIVGAFYEQSLLKKDFGEFNVILIELYEKIDDENCNQNDVLTVQKWWLNKKKSLHIYIPHNDIKEIDYWLAEAVSFVYSKEYTEALSKIEVLIEISEHIPDAYSIKIENIF